MGWGKLTMVGKTNAAQPAAKRFCEVCGSEIHTTEQHKKANMLRHGELVDALARAEEKGRLACEGCLKEKDAAEETAAKLKLLLEGAKVEVAVAKGYESQKCRECGNYTIVRNGDMTKCNTCGDSRERIERMPKPEFEGPVTTAWISEQPNLAAAIEAALKDAKEKVAVAEESARNCWDRMEGAYAEASKLRDKLLELQKKHAAVLADPRLALPYAVIHPGNDAEVLSKPWMIGAFALESEARKRADFPNSRFKTFPPIK